MFNFFKREMGTGAMLDTRPSILKERDYTFEELVSSTAPVVWKEKKPETWRKFPIFNQNGSGSCVAQTAAKLLGIAYFIKEGAYVHFSATDIYQQRANKPNAGMAGHDAFDIIRKNGATLEDLVPSQEMTDAQMDGVSIRPYKREVGRIFRVSNYVIDPIQDIDTIASIIEKTQKGVMVWFFFNRSEWTNTPTILDRTLSPTGTRTLRHSITAVDYTLYRGKKALIVEDSWGVKYGIGGQRVITEDFFKVRNFFAGHLMNFDFESGAPDIPKPSVRFRVQMEYTPVFTVVDDVRKLQDILKLEKVFPANVDSTGYYGSVTARAVLAFQRKYQVASEAELNALQGKICGPATLTKLNQLYP